MKIKKLTDRNKNVFTPLVHKDSVVNAAGSPLKKWIAPIAIQGVQKDDSAYTDFQIVDGNHIGIKYEKLEDSATGGYYSKLTFTHDDTTTVSTGTEKMFLLGAVGATGNQKVVTTSGDTPVTFDPSTETLKVKKIDAELLGTKGQMPYQSDKDVTDMLDIGTSGQILMVQDGLPKWVNKTAGVIGSSWANGSTAGPVLSLNRENMEDLVLDAIPAASTNTSGVVVIDNSKEGQHFGGNKTFDGNVTVAGDLTVEGDLIAIETKEVEVADKMITLAISKDASVATGNNSGVEVTTVYNGEEVAREDRYQGPNLLWTSTNGWTTGNTDPTVRSRDINIGDAEGWLRFGGTQVLSAKQYYGNAKTADKVNETIKFSTSKIYDGSTHVDVGQNDIDGTLNVAHGGTGCATLVTDTLYLGNGTDAIKPLTNGSEYQVVAINKDTKIPTYETLTLNHIPSVAFTLYEDTTLPEVDDFAEGI